MQILQICKFLCGILDLHISTYYFYSYLHIRLVFPLKSGKLIFLKFQVQRKLLKNNNHNILLAVPQTANEKPSCAIHTVSLLFLNHIQTEQLMQTTTAERSDAEAENIFSTHDDSNPWYAGKTPHFNYQDSNTLHKQCDLFNTESQDFTFSHNIRMLWCPLQNGSV